MLESGSVAGSIGRIQPSYIYKTVYNPGRCLIRAATCKGQLQVNEEPTTNKQLAAVVGGGIDRAAAVARPRPGTRALSTPRISYGPPKTVICACPSCHQQLAWTPDLGSGPWIWTLDLSPVQLRQVTGWVLPLPHPHSTRILVLPGPNHCQNPVFCVRQGTPGLHGPSAHPGSSHSVYCPWEPNRARFSQ